MSSQEVAAVNPAGHHLHEGHNASPQVGVETNPDPDLEYGNEHHHRHVHHGAAAAAATDKDNEIMYANEAEIAAKAAVAKGSEDSIPAYTAGEKTVEHQAHAKSLDDVESGNVGSIQGGARDGESQSRWTVRAVYSRFKPVFHFLFWALWTIWWVYGIVYHRNDFGGWVVPFLVWLAITIRVITFWVPARLALIPLKFGWDLTVMPIYKAIPKTLHQPIAAAGTFAVILVGTFVPGETGDNTRANRAISIFGLLVMIFVLWATSRDRKRIPWHTVIAGMLCQFIIAVFVLRTQAGYDIFNFISTMARDLLGFADQGTVFLTAPSVADLHWFLTGVLPPIVFFISLVQLLYHVGFLQWFIRKFATFFFWSLRVSGAEAVVAAATPFVGQGESAILIRPFVPHLTLAEIHQVMTCGFATIAGSVLVAYIGLGLNPQALVSSCIMSIPASLAVSKMRYPETEETLTSGRVVVPEDSDNRATNSLHAFANGAWLGLRVAGLILATLLCIIAMIGLINGLLTWWGHFWNPDIDLTLQWLLGYMLYPVAWLLGVPNADLRLVGQVIGVKIIANEYVAFSTLTSDPSFATLSPRSRIIATYACCGFGNIGSLGTQIGVLSQIAPGRAGDVSRVALSALFSGVLATLTSASIAGMLFTDGMGGFSS